MSHHLNVDNVRARYDEEVIQRKRKGDFEAAQAGEDALALRLLRDAAEQGNRAAAAFIEHYDHNDMPRHFA